MLNATMTPALLASIQAGATVLTGSTRLAHALRHDAEQWQRKQCALCWRTPDIVPWTQWLERCWRERLQSAGEARLLLRPSQEQLIWRELIEPAGGGASPLLDVEATCRNAMQAWSLASEWNLDFEAEEWGQSQDAEAFRGWALAFERRCQAQQWLSAARLPLEIARQFRQGEAEPPPAPLVLAGFDELTPAQMQIVEALRGCGAEVEILPVEAEAALRTGWLSLRNNDEEILQAAVWARALVESEGGSSGPIGIVVPGLANLRARVERIFTDVFHPEDELETPRTGWRAFNLSLGLPLSDYPVVQGALQVLEAVRATLQGRSLPCREIGQLLRSPWLGGAESERTQRARLDAWLRKRQEMEMPVAELARWAGQPAAPCPLLAAALQRLLEWCGAVPRRQSFPAWAASLQSLLETLRWPGDRPLDSAEHQTWQAFLALLPELERLDQVSGPAPFAVALAHLRRLLAQSVFQPESVTAPVQVMGLLESTGMRFGRLRVLGLHDGIWPATARPNPFLPLELQRRHNLPHASAAREFAFARQRMQLLLSGAPEVIFSVPEREGDSELHPSPLLLALPRLDPPAGQPVYQRPVERLRGTARLEQMEDHVAPPVGSGEQARGGSGIFSRQAACPFQSFASHRLFAEPLETPAPGLDARQRGQLLHEAMEAIWSQLHDHATLTAQDAGALQQSVTQAVGQVLAAHERDVPALRRRRLRAIEQECLSRLLLEWLELEKRRPAFRVLQQERERHVDFAGLSLRLRADRMDELEDGRRIVLDYKTGEHHVSEWLGARPRQPQLPLYAVASEPAPSALAFARMRTGKTGFHGLAAEAGLLPGVGTQDEPPWAQQLEEWRLELDRLATEFRGGWALADPRDGALTCRTCDFTALCRISDAGASSLGDAEEGDASDATDR